MQVDLPLNLRYGGIALFCIGPAVLLLTGIGAISAWDIHRWPEVTAEVLRTDIEKSQAPIAISRKGRTANADYFKARCTYAFEVDGKRFTKEGICAESFDRTEVSRKAQHYSTGNQITIYYSPRNPKHSVLSNKADIFGLSIGFGMGALAFPLGFAMRRIARNMEPKPAISSTPDSAPAGHMQPFQPNFAPACEPFAGRQSVTTGPSSVIFLLLRGISICAGSVFVFLGGLCVAVSVYQIVKVPDASKPEVDMAVRVVAALIFALVPLFGAFLIWLGLRRTRSRQQPAAPMTHPSQHPTDLGVSPLKPSSFGA